MSDLSVDIGNSRIKWFFNGDYQAIEYDAENLASLLDKHWQVLHKPDQILISDVSAIGQQLAQWCEQKWHLEAKFFSPDVVLPELKFAYADASLLGVDRKLAMLAGYHLYGKQHEGELCIIDAGTALTMDFMNHHGHHLGGYIVPGYSTMLRSLQADTHALNIQEQEVQQLSPGTNTHDGITRGCMAMLVDFCQLRIQENENTTSMRVVLTGGFASHLQPFLKCETVLHEHLVLQGLQIWNQGT